MFTYLHRHGIHPRTPVRTIGAHLSRWAAALTAVTCGLLASAATVPAAFARMIPPPGGSYGTTRVVPGPGTAQIVTVGGMAGWQITLIAVGAALAGAAATLLLTRARAAHRAAPATSA
jgi:hypothetical protein